MFNNATPAYSRNSLLIVLLVTCGILLQHFLQISSFAPGIVTASASSCANSAKGASLQNGTAPSAERKCWTCILPACFAARKSSGSSPPAEASETEEEDDPLGGSAISSSSSQRGQN